jgi:hypothetical protein
MYVGMYVCMYETRRYALFFLDSIYVCMYVCMYVCVRYAPFFLGFYCEYIRRLGLNLLRRKYRSLPTPAHKSWCVCMCISRWYVCVCMILHVCTLMSKIHSRQQQLNTHTCLARESITVARPSAFHTDTRALTCCPFVKGRFAARPSLDDFRNNRVYFGCYI